MSVYLSKNILDTVNNRIDDDVSKRIIINSVINKYRYYNNHDLFINNVLDSLKNKSMHELNSHIEKIIKSIYSDPYIIDMVLVDKLSKFLIDYMLNRERYGH